MLSQAIVRGASLRPQADKVFCDFFKIDQRTGILCSDALGAAFEAATGRTFGSRDELFNVFPQLKTPVTVPVCLRETGRWPFQNPTVWLYTVIWGLNDLVHMDRTAIATVVEAMGF